MKTKSIIATLSALALSVALGGCAQQQAPQENATPATEITVTAEGWNADTDTPAALVITSEVTEEGAEPATTEYVVVEPNAAEPTTVELSEGNYDVAMVYPVSADGQAFTRPADAQELTLTVEGDNHSLDITLDQKRALAAEEIQTAIDTINASTIEQDTKEKILAAYTVAEATDAEDTSADTAATSEDTSSTGGAAVATSNSGNSGSTSAPAASAPAAPAHQHSWEPVYSTTSVVVCTCCDGTTFTGSAGIARSQAASHEVALGNAHPDECHGNSHISQSTSTQQTKTGERCSGCGATR